MAPARITSGVKVFLISAFHAPFIQDDIDALRKHVDLRCRIGHGLRSIFPIVTGVLRSDVVFCWFASVYAFLAVFTGRLFGVRSCVVVGGVDAAKDEKLGYGIWLSPWKSKLVRYVFRNASRILVVDQSLREEAKRLAEYDGANISLFPTGYRSSFWRPLGEKEPIVLTVAAARDEITVRRKGLDVLAEAARKLPGVTFVIVGTDEKILHGLRLPMNVRCQGWIPREQILPCYQRAKVYCQPSRREGLPNALCEAMLCGCIPVGCEVNGIPTAIGDAGFLVPPGDAEALTGAIRSALSAGENLSVKSRARIVSLFPAERRENGLAAIIGELVS